MNLDDIDDFDPAAFGFSGFGGAKSKGKAASTAKAKHAPAAATTTTTAKALSPVQKNVQAAEEPAAASLTGVSVRQAQGCTCPEEGEMRS